MWYLWLEVPVHDPARVHVAQRQRQLRQQAPRRALLQRARQLRGQLAARRQLRHYVREGLRGERSKLYL